ncbi:hypothetical protein KXD40_008481 [Peronospora effusa]|nr:hypothetical protein KXD40_008481 [Peronospora effusa]
MKLYYAISLMAVFAQASAARRPSFHSDLSEWKDCSDFYSTSSANPTNTKAECAVYSAPLCYRGICKTPKHVKPTVDILVKRIPAEGNPKSATNLWVLSGVDGASSGDKVHSRLSGKVNVYTMDQRGTGRSTLLDCIEMPTITTAYSSSSNFNVSQVPACAHALEKKYGPLSSFSITSAATDVVTFISDFSNGMNTIVCGISYGTMVVERLIHLNPREVTGYVLDSVFTTSGAPRDKTLYVSASYTNYGKVGDTFMALCETESKCNKHFVPNNLQATLQDLITKFDENPKSTCAALMSKLNSDQSSHPASYVLRQILGNLLLDASMRTFIPPLVYRLNRCEAKDVDVLTHFIKIIVEINAQGDNDDSSYVLLYYLITFSEMWERPPPSIKEMNLRYTNARMTNTCDGGRFDVPLYCAFSKEESAVCGKLDVGNYVGNGIVYAVDKYWNTSAKIPPQASVLLLNSKLDEQAPQKFAKHLFKLLDGDKKELITFEDSVHIAMISTHLGQGGETCGMKLLVSYVTNDGDLERLDKSCVDEMPAFSMTPLLDHQHYFLSTDDAYDGVYNERLYASVTGPTSSTSSAGQVLQRDEHQD